jgi:hypothetical protein
MANKYLKKRLTSLAIKERQIKIIQRFHVSPAIMGAIKKT